MTDQDEKAPSKPSKIAVVNPLKNSSAETTSQKRVLDLVLYRLTSQWGVEQDKIAGKREQLLRVLQEVGPARLQAAILRTLDEYHGDFCPPLSFIRTRIPPKSEEEEQRHFCSLCDGNGWIYSNLPDEMGNSQVRRCPNYGSSEFLVSGNHSTITPEERRDRELHPENWYGEADMLAYMRIRKVKPDLTSDQIWEVVDEARRLMHEAKKTKNLEGRTK